MIRQILQNILFNLLFIVNIEFYSKNLNNNDKNKLKIKKDKTIDTPFKKTQEKLEDSERTQEIINSDILKENENDENSKKVFIAFIITLFCILIAVALFVIHYIKNKNNKEKFSINDENKDKQNHLMPKENIDEKEKNLINDNNDDKFFIKIDDIDREITNENLKKLFIFNEDGSSTLSIPILNTKKLIEQSDNNIFEILKILYMFEISNNPTNIKFETIQDVKEDNIQKKLQQKFLSKIPQSNVSFFQLKDPKFSDYIFSDDNYYKNEFKIFYGKDQELKKLIYEIDFKNYVPITDYFIDDDIRININDYNITFYNDKNEELLQIMMMGDIMYKNKQEYKFTILDNQRKIFLNFKNFIKNIFNCHKPQPINRQLYRWNIFNFNSEKKPVDFEQNSKFLNFIKQYNKKLDLLTEIESNKIIIPFLQKNIQILLKDNFYKKQKPHGFENFFKQGIKEFDLKQEEKLSRQYPNYNFKKRIKNNQQYIDVSFNKEPLFTINGGQTYGDCFIIEYVVNNITFEFHYIPPNDSEYFYENKPKNIYIKYDNQTFQLKPTERTDKITYNLLDSNNDILFKNLIRQDDEY